MRLSALILPVLCAACGPDRLVPQFVVPPIDLAPCPGWTGGRPATDRQLGDALAITLHRAECDERKMRAGADTLAALPAGPT